MNAPQSLLPPELRDAVARINKLFGGLTTLEARRNEKPWRVSLQAGASGHESLVQD